MDSAKDRKEQYLRECGALNVRASSVTDSLFSGSEFFDARDLVLVKYEMLRRVRVDGLAVAQAAAAFGFSRSGFYKALSAWERRGLLGLFPSQPGPRGAHKLTAEVLEFIDRQLELGHSQRAPALASLIQDELGLHVHPRSIERALLKRRQKGGL